MSGREQRSSEKRAAFELPAALDLPAGAPQMKRPVATTAGAALVLLRVIAGLVWVAIVAFDWSSWFATYDGDPSDATPELRGITLVIFVVVAGGFLLGEAVFGLLILSGRNFPRMVVMVFAVLSISSAFAGWWRRARTSA